MAERRKTIDSVRLMNARTAEELLGTLLSSFPERSGVITRERYGVVDGRAKTLEEIGQSHGITRERVRQIVDVIMKRIKEVMAQADEHQLVERVQQAVRSGGGILTIEKLLSLLGKGKVTEEKALQALLPVFPGVQIGKETVKRKPVVTVDTFVMKDWESVIASVTNLLKKSGEVQSLDDLYTHYRKQSDAIDLPKDIFESFLHSSVEIEMNAFGRYGLMHWSTVRPRGTRERAHLILQVMKKPLHFREIARLIDEHGLYKTGKKTHPQTVHNELIKDERFVLVGRGTYALSDWGFRPGTVREVLSSILSEHETPMTREELLKAVMKVRQVKRSTVIINLNSFFTKVGKNIYSLASEKE